ncbi:NAD(P)-dependent dehydrogenase, short-chain alcohol dehydrogenase family [Mycolicibacterium rutilum]|uniref:3-oxoacyl-[acyl-carrier-protein] reductase MabA n=1 Tax=Mycolicibacterium rutilum TaxID=370526 RepID=A0A1H6IK37_MYCRU|nr:SDR family NAD(P)-dependent oxidoreductase [Mycolicibacterium rutilum]SEH48307.1 NAD(P)-dependent dehydrogenase, short-chain alcohol dehydrogenase family [Mycolicibacterium rutilum]
MDMGLVGRRALVTGSSAGIGAAIAEMLAEEGAAVVVHGRDRDRTEAVAHRIEAVPVVGDLSTDAGAAYVADAASAGGPIDILVNNAGGYEELSWSDAVPEQWAQVYQANVVSGVRMIRHLTPAMRQRGWGRVIQIGGGLAVQPMAIQPHYQATLAARHNLTVSLARELAGTGITANTVAPGAILTDQVAELLMRIAPEHGWTGNLSDVERVAAESWIPNDVGRFGRPDEIAAAVVFLAGKHADYISGATIRVDGGTIRSVA